jgi:hypothetical protein
MGFPIATALSHEATLKDIERAIQNWLDTVVLPVNQNNWRKVRELMSASHENGWDVKFVLWAKGQQVKSVPLHRIANHPSLEGWLVQDVSDPVLIAMLRATTELGYVWSWWREIPFTHGVLSHQPASQHWWAWIAVGEVENLAGQVIRALLSGAEGICFSYLPTEDNPLECERLKAIGFLAVHLRLWKPLLSERPNFSEAWEWKTDEVSGWVWSLEGEETLCLFSPLTFSPTLWLKFPFVVREGVRAYSVQFPALVRLPLQRKGNNTFVKFSEPKLINMVWLTSSMERVQRMHHIANELMPKAMQFAVQWVLARKERLGEKLQAISGIDDRVWSMLQKARRRQFSYGYTEAYEILSASGAFGTLTASAVSG